MALHLITIPDAGEVQHGKRHQKILMLLECSSMTTLDHMIIANGCGFGDLVGDKKSQFKMLEAHNLMPLLSYCEVRLAPDLHQTV